MSTRLFAWSHVPAVGTITSSPGRQSAGKATLNASAVCNPINTLLISSKFRQRIINNGSDYALRIYEEYSSHCFGIAFSRLKHSVQIGYFHGNVFNKRELYFNIFHTLVLNLLFDGPQPGNVAVQPVHR